MSDYMINLIEQMDCSDLSYEEWLQVGMGLKHEGYPLSLWDSFSQHDTRYHKGECERKWNSFKRHDITGATITSIAKAHGWFSKTARPVTTWGWDDNIIVDWDGDDTFNDLIRRPVIDTSFVERQDVPANEPIKNWQTKQALDFIKVLFRPGERIAFTYEAFCDEDGKWKPSGKGTSRTYEDIVKNLKKHPEDISYAFATPEPKAGMWVRSNPMDGKGCRNENITDYRYALIESDSLPIEEQYSLLKALNIPIATLVHSGKKSLHALVRINATNKREYEDRVRKLYAYCERNGLKVDTQNKNPSRLTRLPGVQRGDAQQYLIDTNIGAQSWDDWYEYIQEEQDTLPDIVDFADVAKEGIPELSPELIEGILRQGHKMLLSGPSKAGKSFCLIQLAVAIANGGKWLDNRVSRGKCLYINLELDERSCYHRIKDVCEALYPSSGINAIEPGYLSVWNLRGKAQAMKSLTPRLIRRIRNKGYTAVILDPIYKVTAGDENSAEQMGDFCNELDKVCQEVGVSMIYCHHHSKGSQAYKSSIDRGSGSGVFGRDADAIMDMLQLGMSDDVREKVPERTTAWRIEYTLREFAEPDLTNVFFEYPIHVIDTLNLLENAQPKETYDAGQRGSTTTKTKAKNRADAIIMAIESGLYGENPTLQEVAEIEELSEKTLRRYIKNSDLEIVGKDESGKSVKSYIRTN